MKAASKLLLAGLVTQNQLGMNAYVDDVLAYRKTEGRNLASSRTVYFSAAA